MLPKINRIRKKKDFESIFKNSKSFKNNLFIFKITKNELDINRFGFIISSKVSKRATIRNKIRRRLAEIIKKEINSANQVEKLKNGKDVVIIALRGIEKKEFPILEEAVKNTIIKSGLYLK
ncbi:MAG: ribonuclease P protein component [Candidatus Staskawiczbacteria bacterium]|jgi:ribonuclease P protein component